MDIVLSRLARALWIEIPITTLKRVSTASRLARALWIEIHSIRQCRSTYASRLARALWIEITGAVLMSHGVNVEARESLVD